MFPSKTKNNDIRFKELKEELKAVGFDTLRLEREDYLELVVTNDKLGALNIKLTSLLGPAIWPSQKRLEAEVEKGLEDFGGILPGQSLYFKRQGREVFFVMLWPWKDGQHVTIKVIKGALPEQN